MKGGKYAKMFAKFQVKAIFHDEIAEEMVNPNLQRSVWRRHAARLPIPLGTNMAAGNQQGTCHLSPSFATKA